MKKASSILLLLLMSFSLMSFSCTNSNKSKALDINTQNTLKQYVGDYMYEGAGIILKIYTVKEL